MERRYKILSFAILGIAFVSTAFGATYLISYNPYLPYVNSDAVESLQEVKKFKELYPEATRNSVIDETGIRTVKFSSFEHDTSFVYDGPNKTPNNIELKIVYYAATKSLLDAELRCTYNDKADIVSDTIVDYLSKYDCFKQEPEYSEPLMDPSDIIDANNQFALNFYSQINDDSNNIFFSPWSISTAFAILQEGARGNTSEEIHNVFGFPADSSQRQSGFETINENLNQHDSKHVISIANSLWLAYGFSPHPEFVDVVKNSYQSHIQEIDFQKDGVDIINAWVDDQTQKKIPELFVPGSLDSAVFAIANAIYFKGAWDNQFDPEKTQNRDFWMTGDSAISVPMMYMHQSEQNIALLDEVQLLELPYDGGRLSMLVLLPNEIDGLDELESTLSIEKIQEWKKDIVEQSVVVVMPKFKLETDYELIPELQSMGISDVFGRSSDLSGISNLDLFVGEAVHKAFIEVNEEGTESAAATGIGGFTGGPPIFAADHPFVFIIQDNDSENILFMGRVVNPLQ